MEINNDFSNEFNDKNSNEVNKFVEEEFSTEVKKEKKPNNKIWIIIVVLVVLDVSGYFIWAKVIKNDDNKKEENPTKEVENKPEEGQNEFDEDEFMNYQEVETINKVLNGENVKIEFKYAWDSSIDGVIVNLYVNGDLYERADFAGGNKLVPIIEASHPGTGVEFEASKEDAKALVAQVKESIGVIKDSNNKEHLYIILYVPLLIENDDDPVPSNDFAGEDIYILVFGDDYENSFQIGVAGQSIRPSTAHPNYSKYVASEHSYFIEPDAIYFLEQGEDENHAIEHKVTIANGEIIDNNLGVIDASVEGAFV